ILLAVAGDQWPVVSKEKPASVSLATDHWSLNAVPKIADFGLAKQDEVSLTATSATLGTPAYMAPEQAEGRSKDVRPAADLYALGAVLYEMLTGQPPFTGTSVMDTLEQVRHREPRSLLALRPDLPRDLVTICLRALAKEPRSRFASAEALAD